MTSNHADLLEAAAAEVKPKANLAQVQEKAARLIEIELELADCEKREKDLKAEREQIRIRELPQMCFELETKVFSVRNKTCEIEPLIQATIPKDEAQKRKAFNFLVDHKAGGGINRTVTVVLPKGDAKAEHLICAAIKKVEKGKFTAEVTETIHHMTYTKAVKDLINSGVKVPLDVLGAFVGQIARVK